MKKILALALALIMCLSLFGACASDETPAQEAPASEAPASEAPAEDSAEAPTEEPSEAPAEEGEPAPAEGEGYIGLEAAMEKRVNYDLPICTTGEVYTMFETTADTSGNAVASIYPDYYYEQVGIKLEKTSVPNSVASEKLNLTIAAEVYYDIMPMSTAGLFSSVDVAVEEGVLWDFAPYIEKFMPNYNVLIHSDPQYESNGYSDKGALTSLMQFYHVPYTSDYGPMLRQDMLEGVNMEAPVTYDDWDVVLRAVKEEYDLDAALCISQSGVGRSNYFVAGYGIAGEVALSPMLNVPLYIEEDTVKYGAIADSFYDYLMMMHNWYADGILYKDYYIQTGWSPNSDIIYENECFSWQDDSRMIDTYQYNMTQPDAVVWPVADPVLEEGSTKILATSSRVTENGVCLSTSLMDKDYETFLKCMDWGYSPECDILLTYGLEGESFEYDAEGNPQFTELITNNPEGYSFRDAKTIYSVVTAAGSVMYNEASNVMYSEAYLACAPLWDRSYGEITTMDMDVSLSSEESEAYSLLISDIVTYSGEMITKFIVGEADLEAGWDEYVQTIKDLKIDEALSYQQAAYDRFNGRAG